MVDPIDDGGPAFPMPPHMGVLGTWIPGVPGMSLRDWFAGMLGHNGHFIVSEDGATDERNAEYNRRLARSIYAAADVMLAERKRGGAS